VQPTVLAEIKHVFEHRSPRKINETNTEKNLKDYYYYGNHDSVNDNKKEVGKVLLKDHRRGNTLLVDRRLFAYIPNSHLSPQGLADLFDAWKEAHIYPIVHIVSTPESITLLNQSKTTSHGFPIAILSSNLTVFLVILTSIKLTRATARRRNVQHGSVFAEKVPPTDVSINITSTDFFT
jgi:hypothetical protein